MKLVYVLFYQLFYPLTINLVGVRDMKLHLSHHALPVLTLTIISLPYLCPKVPKCRIICERGFFFQVLMQEHGDDQMAFGFRVKRAEKQSILHHLRDRETFISKPNTHHHVARKFYCNILPNYTLIDVEKPPCFLRKFSPDGKYFVAFSSDQASLEIYEFQGKS